MRTLASQGWWLFGGWRHWLALAAVGVLLLAGCSSAQSNPGTDLGSGALLAFIGQDGNLWMARSDSSGAHAITATTCAPTTSCYGPPAWSPDGQRVAVFGPKQGGTGNAITIFNRLGVVQTTLLPADPLSFGPLLWSADGQSLAYQGRASMTSATDSLVVLTATSGAQAAIIAIPPLDPNCSDAPQGGQLGTLVDHAINGYKGFRYTYDWSHDGNHFLLASGQCSLAVSLVARTGGTPQTIAPLSTGALLTQGAFSRDGQLIVATQHGDSEDDLVLFTGTGANGHIIYTDKDVAPIFVPRLSSPVFAPTNGQIYFMRGADLWVVNADGSGARQLATGVATGDPLKAEAEPLPSPDGKYLAWMELTYSTTDNLPRTSLMVGQPDATGAQVVAVGAVWPSWS